MNQITLSSLSLLAIEYDEDFDSVIDNFANPKAKRKMNYLN